MGFPGCLKGVTTWTGWLCVGMWGMFFLSCGEGPSRIDTADGPPQETSTCPSCAPSDATGTDSSNTSQKVLIEPKELMFYGDAQRIAQIQTVKVQNASSSPVVWVGAYVLDDPSMLTGEGAAPYFRTQSPLPGTLIAPGETVSVGVSFVFSDEQRNALLRIYTSYQAQAVSSVKLSGKYFP
jgi:hypothetical protein